MLPRKVVGDDTYHDKSREKGGKVLSMSLPSHMMPPDDWTESDFLVNPHHATDGEKSRLSYLDQNWVASPLVVKMSQRSKSHSFEMSFSKRTVKVVASTLLLDRVE